MFNIIATFSNILDVKKLIKILKKNPKVKGHILVINKAQTSTADETYISSVLIKRTREIAKLKLDDTKKGIIFGAIIGGLSSLIAVLINISLLHISTLAFIGICAIIFYGATVGAIIGLLISNIIRKYDEKNFCGEITLIIKEVDDNVKDIVIDKIKEYNPTKLNIY
ncbi:hypothetical protein [Caminicella sporogenes]|uniref:hypothetical protein n=1 Tax=Caminicella sporogenes TaxID=166485 RepID=UPI0025409353|nr:hypothetical protein [Caminicella sporogenes]WIF93984.1 hypothetical protein QNI18_06590 [Caminicella sporogenes]